MQKNTELAACSPEIIAKNFISELKTNFNWMCLPWNMIPLLLISVICTINKGQNCFSIVYFSLPSNTPIEIQSSGEKKVDLLGSFEDLIFVEYCLLTGLNAFSRSMVSVKTTQFVVREEFLPSPPTFISKVSCNSISIFTSHESYNS